MDAAQRTLQQALALWRGLGRPQQIGLAAVAAAAIGVLMMLTTLGRGPDMAVAFSSLNDEDAAAVVNKLKDAKIPYEVGDRGTISVPGPLVNDVKLMMAGQGLGGKPGTGAGFEMFNQPAFGQTEFAQKVNYQRALESELARSIGRMDAVDSARVHLALPQQTLFASQQKDATASVILKLKPGKRLDSSQVRSIVALVSGSVEGLKTQNIAIVDVYGNVLSDEDSRTGPAGITNKQLEAQRSYESSMERNLQTLLDSVLGPGKAAVRVSAAFDWSQVEQTSETYGQADPSGTPVVKTSRESSEKQAPGTTANQTGGVPGTTANGAALPTYQGPQNSGQGGYEKSDKEVTYDTSRTVQKTVRTPGTLKDMSVSVLIDNSVLTKVENAPEKIQSAIQKAAGVPADKIAVVDLPFDREQQQQMQVEIAQSEQRDQILTYGRIAALVLGPIVLLAALWFLLGRPTQVAARSASELKAAAAAATASGAEAGEQQTLAPIPSKPPKPIAEDPQKAYIRNQITTLAKTNPSTVAQLIQTWMDEDRRN